MNNLEERTMREVVVIGAGVSGLSSGIRLLEAGFDVTIFTRELPEQTTSAAAGAVWWGWIDAGREREWARASLKEFQRLARIPESGVRETELRSFYPEVEPWFKDDMPAFASIDNGYAFIVPIIETPRYLRYLQGRFESLGGRIEQREISHLSDLDDGLIVHCAGVGARQTANDAAVYPIRGQVVRVEAPQITQAFEDNDTFTYIFPRGDGVILGGVAQPGNWSREAHPAITEDILRRCSAVEPSVRGAKILATPVGLRPGRHEVRLEIERISEHRVVIHNYGHAGIGYTLSWGCAAEVAALAENLGGS
jgi:D-amino-acid oxidase